MLVTIHNLILLPSNGSFTYNLKNTDERETEFSKFIFPLGTYNVNIATVFLNH